MENHGKLSIICYNIRYLNKNDKEAGNNYIILAGFIAMTQGMNYELSQMAWALEPVLKEIGEERFAEIGRKLAREKGLIP